MNNPDHLKINGDETRTEDEDSSSHFSIQALDPLLERFSLVVNKTSIERVNSTMFKMTVRLPARQQICMEMVEALTTADPPPVASPKRKRTDASTGHLADEEKVLGVFCSSLSAIVQEHLSSQAAAAGSRSGLDTAMAPFVSAQSKTMPHSTFPTIAGALEQPVKLMVGTSDVVSLSQDTQLSQASLYQDSLLSHDALLSQDSWPSILSNEGDAWIGSQATFNSCESVKASGTSDSPTTWSTYQDQSEGRTIHPTSDDSDKCDTSAPVGGHLPVEVCSEPEGAMETYGLSHVQTQSSTMTQDEAGCFAGTSDASLSSSLPTVIASGEFYILPTEHAAIALGPYSQSHPNTTPMEESPMTFHPPIHHPTDSTLGHSFSFPYFQPQSEVASCNISSHDSPSGLNSVNHSEAPVNEENTGNHNVDASQPLSEGSASSPQAPLDIPLEKLQQILQTKPDVCSHIQMILGDETLTNEDKEAAVNRIIMSLHVADEKSLPSQSVWSV